MMWSHKNLSNLLKLKSHFYDIGWLSSSFFSFFFISQSKIADHFDDLNHHHHQHHHRHSVIILSFFVFEFWNCWFFRRFRFNAKCFSHFKKIFALKTNNNTLLIPHRSKTIFCFVFFFWFCDFTSTRTPTRVSIWK